MSGDRFIVRASTKAYPVVAVRGGAEAVAHEVAEVAPRGRLIIVGDDNTLPLYAEPLAATLNARGRVARSVGIAAGESAKSVASIETLWRSIFGGAVDRGDTVVAVGGGVVGDAAGFAAATVMRGIGLIQVPTTVLAMADASIGGKVGINLPEGKNLVGAFYPPTAVIQWIDALSSLDAREVRSGLAEVVKSAIIAGAAEFEALEAAAPSLARGEPAALQAGVQMAARLKGGVVERDEHEAGERRLLNLGHTFGHVIEHAAGYGTWTHGEAVAAGMVIALRLGERLSFGSSALTDRVIRLLDGLKLPTTPPSLTVDEWVTPLRRDKKRSGESIALVLCNDLGDCGIHQTTFAELVDRLELVC